MYKKIIALSLAFLLTAGTIAGCGQKKDQAQPSINQDVVDMSALNNTTSLLAGTDDLGRVVEVVSGNDETKEVGIFYPTWLGTYDAGNIYDVSKILENDPNAADDHISWLKAGGGTAGSSHWWGESLFGYYFSTDEWVAERDVQMLTDAGIDFLLIDYSNNVPYPEQWEVLLKALDKYYRQGFEVPQITFLIKAENSNCVEYLYDNLYMAKPEYAHLWYRSGGKPMLVCNSHSTSMPEKYFDYFSMRYSQWPREDYQSDGFPWMDFGIWTEDGKPAIFGGDGFDTVMSVSVAQHGGSLAYSTSAFYGDQSNHTRSWHDGANDPAEDAYLYGYNFAEQFEYAIECNPDVIIITGWNEWVATRQSSWHDIDDPVILVDCANINNSRDIQPMKGGYGDNYYMQMVNYIRQFKGAPVTNVALNTAAQVKPITIDVNGGMNQWNSVGGYYLDYIYDTNDRKAVGYGGLLYTDETGRNDIYKIKLANDSEKLYAYIQTMDVIEGLDGEHCLSMFISTGNKENENWCGYDFVVGRKAATNEGLTIEKRTTSGWEIVGTAKYSVVLNELQFEIDLSVLGLNAEDISIAFKFADNYQGEDDLYSFYLNGDAAPYGRLNYVYESQGIDAITEFVINPNKAVPTGTIG